MLSERVRMQAVPRSNSTTYIPITFHLVGDGNGRNYSNPLGALGALCRLNADFAAQNVQFYLNPAAPLRYMPNQTVYSDGYDWGAMSIMGDEKLPNAFNVYIGNSVSRPVAGYYSPSEDFVFLQRGYANGNSTTFTHEAGHFYSLPHTFYGWEGVNYDDVYNGAPAPVVVNGDSVEYQTRLGANANCSSVADGFCDTEADYYSDREACNHNSVVLDPAGDRLTPDNTNYMSYFYDACQTSFSTEQKDAIWRNITMRGWTNFGTPNLNTVTSDSVQALLPLENDSISFSTTNNNVRFSWTAAPDAMGYVLTVERMFRGSVVDVVQRDVTYTNSYTLPAAIFAATGSYRWSIVPFGQYSTCSARTVYANFYVRNLLTTSVLQNNIDNNLSLHIAPNPPASSVVQLWIESALAQDAQVAIYGIDGRVMLRQACVLTEGSQLLQLPTDFLPQGLYVVSVQTQLSSRQQRLIIQR